MWLACCMVGNCGLKSGSNLPYVQAAGCRLCRLELHFKLYSTKGRAEHNEAPMPTSGCLKNGSAIAVVGFSHRLTSEKPEPSIGHTCVPTIQVNSHMC